MGINQASTDKGREAARDFRENTKAEERKVEDEKGSALKKGSGRFEERAKSSDGKGAGAKQK